MRRPLVGWWAGLALCVVVGTVFAGDLVRFENPVGEKHVPLFPPGQNDFSYAYLGARALLAGVNPYVNDRPEFTHPIWPPSDFGGYKQIYPPGNLLSHVPVALWKGTDSEGAGRIWFRASLIELVMLSTIVLFLSRRITGLRLTLVWLPLFFACLTFNTGVELALERGQSDILAALLAWSAVACFLRRHYAASVFLGAWSTSMKGYAIVLTVGLALLAIDRRQWKSVLAGGVGALAIFLFPVRHLMKDAAAALALRKETFWAVWYNHSFSNLVYTLSPTTGPGGRWLVIALAFAVTAAALAQAWRAERAHPASGDEAPWVLAFATAALGTMIGYSKLSVSYNLIMVLPGALTLLTSQSALTRKVGLCGWPEHLVGGSLLAASFLLFRFRLRGVGAPASGTGLAASAVGLALLIIVIAGLVARALVRRRPDRP